MSTSRPSERRTTDLGRIARVGAVIGLVTVAPVLVTAVGPQVLAALRPGGLIGPHLLGLRSGGTLTGLRSGAAALTGLKPLSMPIPVGPADRVRVTLLRVSWRRRLDTLRPGDGDMTGR
ncbi:hypothetical protein SMC26_28435 [Actinomadura fulvescens]|uniref:Uncharacterized protein n=1 Tax=Actinomadura fulvescens TaxID=46160 RepID=A0ABN3PBU4_9ACTN